MLGIHSKKMSDRASENPNFGQAWMSASINIDNAIAILELIIQSMEDNDWRDLLPDHMKIVSTFAENQRRALDGTIPIFQKVSQFFDDFERYSVDQPKNDIARDLGGIVADNHDEMQLLIDQWHEHREHYDRLAARQVFSDKGREMDALLRAVWSVEDKVWSLPCASSRDVLLKVNFSEKALGQNGEADCGEGRNYFAIIQSLKGLATNG